MHPAPTFLANDEQALLDQLAARPFATLAAAPQGRPFIAHTPVLARRLPQGLVLDFHLSRGNALSRFLAEGFRAVAVTLEADAYISPGWYADQGAVPAWNYVSVEAEGPVEILDEEGLVALLDDLSDQEETRLLPKPVWTRSKMPAGKFETLCRAIVGARLRVERLEGTRKLSQNKSDADRAAVIAALGDHPIARLMRRRDALA